MKKITKKNATDFEKMIDENKIQIILEELVFHGTVNLNTRCIITERENVFDKNGDPLCYPGELILSFNYKRVGNTLTVMIYIENIDIIEDPKLNRNWVMIYFKFV